MIAADTNLIAYLLIEGEGTEEARRVWRADPDWRVPALWRSEFLSVLVTAIRAGLLDRGLAEDAWLRALTLFGNREEEPAGEAVLDEALDGGISAYDAHFVVVARALAVSLVTADREILEACPEVAVSPEAFVSETR